MSRIPKRRVIPPVEYCCSCSNFNVLENLFICSDSLCEPLFCGGSVCSRKAPYLTYCPTCDFHLEHIDDQSQSQYCPRCFKCPEDDYLCQIQRDSGIIYLACKCGWTSHTTGVTASSSTELTKTLHRLLFARDSLMQSAASSLAYAIAADAAPRVYARQELERISQGPAFIPKAPVLKPLPDLVGRVTRTRVGDPGGGLETRLAIDTIGDCLLHKLPRRQPLRKRYRYRCTRHRVDGRPAPSTVVDMRLRQAKHDGEVMLVLTNPLPFTAMVQMRPLTPTDLNIDKLFFPPKPPDQYLQETTGKTARNDFVDNEYLLSNPLKIPVFCNRDDYLPPCNRTPLLSQSSQPPANDPDIVQWRHWNQVGLILSSRTMHESKLHEKKWLMMHICFMYWPDGSEGNEAHARRFNFVVRVPARWKWSR